jgi:murein DD-endopeptidase MepM/ murein hydrolase activator NlpD
MSEAPQIQQRAAGRLASRARKAARVALVILHSDPRPAAEALAEYAAPGARSAPHYYIDVAGAITQLVPEERAARHSGKAVWSGRRRDVDQISIGVVLEHTPGSPLPDAQLGALQSLLSGILARQDLSRDAVLRWEPAFGDDTDVDGVLAPANLPPPIAAPSRGPVVLGEEDTYESDVICGGITPPGPVVLGDDVSEGGASPIPLGDDTSPDAQARLRSFLQGETYRQRGAGFHGDWAFHQNATRDGLGAPLAPSAPAAKQVSFNGKTYGYQPFARDTLFNEGTNYAAVQSLNSLLGGAIPAAGSGLARLLLEASFSACGADLHDKEAFAQRVVRDKLGPPLASGYSTLIGNQKVALQVFAGDTLYTPVGAPGNPGAPTNWGDVRKLSDEPPGPMREGLWGETYKVCGAAYQTGSAFQQLAASAKIGTPLTGEYAFDFEGHPYRMQVFAYDTLYAAQDGVVKRMSALPAAGAAASPATSSPGASTIVAPAQSSPAAEDDPVGSQPHMFHVLPFASFPQIGQPYGYTKFAKSHATQFYSQTQGRHSGMDFMVPVGTQLLSIGYGLVVGAGVPSTPDAPFGGCKPFVILVRYGTVYAVYGHCSQVKVQRGQLVRPGDVLGLSGEFNGPHLHFELRPVPANVLGNRDLGQAAVNPSIALNPMPFFSAELNAYFDAQYARLRGTNYDFCCDSFRNQADTHFGQAIDTRPCTN